MTSESSKNILLTEKNVRKFDMEMKDFVYFKKFLEQNITEDMIEKEKCDQIRNVIKTKLSIEYSKLWIIVFGKDMAYNLQFKKKSLLILSFKSLTFFIYQAKYIDLPILEPLEEFAPDLSEEKVQMYKSRINKVEVRSQDDQHFFEYFQDWTAKFFAKNENKFVENYDNFENLYLRKIKSQLQLYGKQGFWNIFMGQRVNYQLQANKDEVEFLYSIDLTGLPGNRGKKSVAVFQKKGEPNPYFQGLKQRWKEALGFLGMVILFVAMVGCRNYEPIPDEEYLDSDGIFRIHTHPKNIRDKICERKDTLLFVGGAMFFGYIAIKLVSSFYKGIKAKNKLKKSKKA